MFSQPFQVMICRRFTDYFVAISRLFDFVIIICAFLVYQFNRNSKHENGMTKLIEIMEISNYIVHILGILCNMKGDTQFIERCKWRKNRCLAVIFCSDFVDSNSVTF